MRTHGLTPEEADTQNAGHSSIVQWSKLFSSDSIFQHIPMIKILCDLPSELMRMIGEINTNYFNFLLRKCYYWLTKIQ